MSTRTLIAALFTALLVSVACASEVPVQTAEEYQRGRGKASFFVRGYMKNEQGGMATLTLYSLTNDPRRLRDRRGNPVAHWLLYTEDGDLLRVMNQHIVLDREGLVTDTSTYVKDRPIACEFVRVTADGKVAAVEKAEGRRVVFVK